MPKRDWLDDDGNFLFGKYGPHGGMSGDSAEDVAQDDPGYIRWILEEVVDISDEDHSVLTSLIDNRGRLGRQRR